MHSDIEIFTKIAEAVILAAPLIKNGINYLNKPSKFDNAILSLEKAIDETHAFISNCKDQSSNRHLEEIWKETAQKLKGIKNLEDITNIAFEKQLYWKNPQYYSKNNSVEADKIKLIEVRKQLQKLRKI